MQQPAWFCADLGVQIYYLSCGSCIGFRFASGCNSRCRLSPLKSFMVWDQISEGTSLAGHIYPTHQSRKARNFADKMIGVFKVKSGCSSLLSFLFMAVFILCFLFSAPVFGYLGDRYNQKIILSIGISFWSTVTFCSSFIPASMPWLFFISRGLVGVGTSSFSTIAPTIIADLFEKDYRTWMLSVFYIFIPVGSGLGYILSSGVARASGFWGWGFRVSLGWPALSLRESPWFKTVGWSFIGSSLGVTSMGFITGALGFWIPVFLYRAEVVLGIIQPCSKQPCKNHNSEIFGGITIATGILGVVIGAEAARRYKKVNTKADPLICAVGLFSSSPCMYLAIMLAEKSIVAAYILIALAVFFLSLNWAIVADILLYVVKPACQSTALSLQIFMSHLLGDAGNLWPKWDNSTLWDFQSLKYSFVVCIFVGVLGGGCFLMTAVHIEEDSKKAAAPATPLPVTPGQSFSFHSWNKNMIH
uniref:SPNS lysolipid transporter 3, sphingosine-1-phosphate (putative) n=1 Tax=Pseudonaja textilis TaxID=8673 RepID=A0A670XX86_PSETE